MKIYVVVPQGQPIVRETRLKNKDGSFAKEQAVLLHVEGRLAPLETVVLLQQGPFGPGAYEVDGSSFSSGNYGQIGFRLRVGAQLAQAPAKAA